MSLEALLTKNKLFKAEIVKKLNKMIDVPYLDERMEAQIIGQLVNQCMNALMGKMKGTGAATAASGGGKRGIADEVDEGEVDLEAELSIPEEGDEETDEKAKAEMVDSINARFDVPGISEEKEAKFIRYFVDVLFRIKRHKE